MAAWSRNRDRRAKFDTATRHRWRSGRCAPTAHALALVALLTSANTTDAATPRGPEFRFNTAIADSQTSAQGASRGRGVARGGLGATVSVWQSAMQDGDGTGIFGQRFDAAGVSLGGEFLVNVTTFGNQNLPSVGADNGGNFVVVWSGEGPVDASGIFARPYTAAGTPRSGEIAVNTTTAGTQSDADVAVDNGGDFIVVWSGAGPADVQGIYARVFNSNGTPASGEIQVNVDTTGVQSRPTVTTDSNGDFVVVWESMSADWDIYFRRFTRSGSAQGGEVLAHASSAGSQRNPAVSRASNGNFVVVWDGDSAGDRDIFMRHFSGSGTPQAVETRANATARGDQRDACIDLDSGGEFIVAWASDDDSTAGFDWNIRLQQFTKDGFKVSGETVAHDSATGPQSAPSIALDDLEAFTVAWQGAGPGDNDGIFGRFFGLQATADIALGLNVSQAAPDEGSTIQLTITCTNNGPDIATNIAITDLLPTGLTFLSDFATQGNYSATTGIWLIPSMSPLSTDVLQIICRVDTGTSGSTLSDVATLTGLTEVDPVASNNIAMVEVRPTISVLGLTAVQSSRQLLPGQATDVVYRLHVANSSARSETLSAVTFTNRAVGPGSQAELDASWGSLMLTRAGSTTVLATRAFAAGRLRFDALDVAIAPTDSVTLLVHGAPAVVARDGDALDLSLGAAGDVEHSGPASVQATWPLDPPGEFLVDGMTAAQIALHEVGSTTFLAGTAGNLAFDVTLPANGYASDQLQKLNLFNHGTAVAGSDIQGVQAWVDDGDGSYADGQERPLGTLVFTGNRWELTGLAETVPVGGRRLFFTVHVSPTASIGRTVRFGLSGDPDVPIGMASGNDGPIDASVANRFAQTISTADRLVLSAVALPPRTARPGDKRLPLLPIVATNTYASDRTLVAFRVTNATSSPNGGSSAQLDATFESLQLLVDANDDGSLDAADPVLATALFAQGRATFEGFAWSVSTGVSQQFFIVGDVALHAAADGDVLDVQLNGALDVSVLETTSVIASWPLRTSAGAVVDGMVAAQLTSFDAPGVTVGPNEGPALALDLLVPANGYASDVLEGVNLVELGTAVATDVAGVRLWRDGGDATFNPGTGDDTEIAPLVWVDGRWKTPQIAEPIGAGGLRLFVGVTVGSAPTDSATVQLGVPIHGIQTASGNDGPLDQPLTNGAALLLSTAPLSVSLTFGATRANVGQDLSVQMTVRNISNETILGVTPSALSQLGDGGATLLTPPNPASTDMPPGSQADFFWIYRCTSVGTLQFSGQVEGTASVGGLLRRSLPNRSGTLRVMLRASSMSVQPIGNIPFSINRGETDVVPLSLTFTHDGNVNTSDVLLRSMRLRVEDDTGTGLVPADILARLVLREGSLTYFTASTLPASGAEILVDLTTPLLITPDEPATVSFQCDVNAAATAPVFRFALLDASFFTAEDATEGTPVNVNMAPGNFPIQSGLVQLHAAPTELQAQALPASMQRAAQGQAQVALLGLRLSNPGIPNVTTHVRVGALQLRVIDAAGNSLPEPARYFQSLRIKSGALTLEDLSLAASSDSLIQCGLSIPALVPAGIDNDIYIVGDVAPSAPLGNYRLRLGAPSTVDARDDNTHASVPVVYSTTVVEGAELRIEAIADSLRVSGTPQLPANFTVGDTGRNAIVVDLRHPGQAGMGRIRIDHLSLLCRDEARRELSSPAYLDRLSVHHNSLEIAQSTTFPGTGGFDIGLADFFLEPGERAALTIQIDLEVTAPTTFFELVVPAIAAFEANLSSPVRVLAEPGAEMPLSSGLAKLGAPATELVVGLQSRMPAVLAPDGTEVPLGRLSVHNTAVPGSGSIQVDRLVLRASDRSEATIALGAAASQLVLRRDGNVVLQSALSPDSTTVTFVPSPPLIIDAGVTILFEVSASFDAASKVDGFRLGVDRDDVRVVQPDGSSLGVRVQAEAGSSFPLWTQAGSFGTASLRQSFSNFPNPFGAGRQSTTFTYYLPQSGRVTLRILTARGEPVTTLVSDQPRTSGMHQDDIWNGSNGQQQVVQNGTYIAEIDVRLDDGTRERVLRKVAVVR